jgi:hypothetical protein
MVLGRFGKERVIPLKRGKKEGNKKGVWHEHLMKRPVDIPFVEQLKEMSRAWNGNTGFQRYIRTCRGNRRVMINE